MATGDRPRISDTDEEAATLSHSVPRSTRVAQLRRITIIEGPDVGKTFALDANSPSRILLGTSPACAIQLADPAISRRHAAFQPDGRRYRLTDLESTNGTFVEGVAIIDVYVAGGEIVRCGNTVMRLDVEAAAETSTLPNAMGFGLITGASIAMRRLYPLCERLAKSRVPVIIEGETGTGKEVLAESLHEAGRGGPFVVCDCTTVSPSLVESELFGHERGAFTGATSARMGVFEEANGGTLLIDEIGDLDLPLQAKLLRVIDRGELRRVGGQRGIKVDVRVLAATRRDLDKAVSAGTFRDDLFHRLAVARIELPPLRERKGDIPLLLHRFATELGGSPEALPPEIVARFSQYTWPGNVRELRNAVARYIALGDHQFAAHDSEEASSEPEEVSEAELTSSLSEADYSLPFALARRRALARFEREYIERLLVVHDGNSSKAARASGVALRYFRLVKARHLKEDADSGR